MSGETNRERPPAAPVGRRWLPHPVLTGVLTVVWVLLVNSFEPGVLLMGLVLGVAIPMLTRGLWPTRLRVGAWRRIVAYVALVTWDIIVANVQVARLIVFRRADQLRTRFVTVPLDLTVPEAITVFAGTITMTPGTVSCDLSADGRSLLVHCLDADDGEAAVRQMKTRYEARLKEIFE